MLRIKYLKDVFKAVFFWHISTASFPSINLHFELWVLVAHKDSSTPLKSFTSVSDSSCSQLKVEQLATFEQSLSFGQGKGGTLDPLSVVYLTKITFSTFCPLRDNQRKADEKALSAWLSTHGTSSKPKGQLSCALTSWPIRSDCAIDQTQWNL